MSDIPVRAPETFCPSVIFKRQLAGTQHSGRPPARYQEVGQMNALLEYIDARRHLRIVPDRNMTKQSDK